MTGFYMMGNMFSKDGVFDSTEYTLRKNHVTKVMKSLTDFIYQEVSPI